MGIQCVLVIWMVMVVVVGVRRLGLTVIAAPTVVVAVVVVVVLYLYCCFGDPWLREGHGSVVTFNDYYHMTRINHQCPITYLHYYYYYYYFL